MNKFELWKEGLWEDYYAGRISGDSLEEELSEIEAMEREEKKS